MQLAEKTLVQRLTDGSALLWTEEQAGRQGTAKYVKWLGHFINLLCAYELEEEARMNEMVQEGLPW